MSCSYNIHHLFIYLFIYFTTSIWDKLKEALSVLILCAPVNFFFIVTLEYIGESQVGRTRSRKTKLMCVARYEKPSKEEAN